MPTGIATQARVPRGMGVRAAPNRLDLAAMGRVWYLEGLGEGGNERRQRAIGGTPQGQPSGPGQRLLLAQTLPAGWQRRRDPQPVSRDYAEYPANLIRIVERFLFGVDLRLDGSLVLGPTVSEDFWAAGVRADARLEQPKAPLPNGAEPNHGDVLQRRPTAAWAAISSRAVFGQQDKDQWSARGVSLGEGGRLLELPVASERVPCQFEIEYFAGSKSGANQ